MTISQLGQNAKQIFFHMFDVILSAGFGKSWIMRGMIEAFWACKREHCSKYIKP